MMITIIHTVMYVYDILTHSTPGPSGRELLAEEAALLRLDMLMDRWRSFISFNPCPCEDEAPEDVEPLGVGELTEA